MSQKVISYLSRGQRTSKASKESHGRVSANVLHFRMTKNMSSIKIYTNNFTTKQCKSFKRWTIVDKYLLTSYLSWSQLFVNVAWNWTTIDLTHIYYNLTNKIIGQISFDFHKFRFELIPILWKYLLKLDPANRDFACLIYITRFQTIQQNSSNNVYLIHK